MQVVLGKTGWHHSSIHPSIVMVVSCFHRVCSLWMTSLLFQPSFWTLCYPHVCSQVVCQFCVCVCVCVCVCLCACMCVCVCVCVCVCMWDCASVRVSGCFSFDTIQWRYTVEVVTVLILRWEAILSYTCLILLRQCEWMKSDARNVVLPLKCSSWYAMT